MIKIKGVKTKAWAIPVPELDDKRRHNYMGTPSIYGLIRHLVKETNGPYLEIGCYRGVGLLAAGKGTGVEVTGIDNFTGVGYHASNEAALMQNIKPHKNIKFLKGDYKEQIKNLGPQGVIFLDGPHDYEATADQLKLADHLVRPGGFIIVDDANLLSVTKALIRFLIGHSDRWDLVAKHLTNEDGRRDSHPQWWNGIAVIQKKDLDTIKIYTDEQE